MTAATNTPTNTAAAKNTTIKSWADIGHADREQLAEDMGEAIMEIPPHDQVFDNLSASFSFLQATASAS